MASKEGGRSKSPLPMCKYGDKCYRRNAQHLQQYRHPKRKSDEHEEGATPGKKVRKIDEKGTIGGFFKKKTEKKRITEEEEKEEYTEPKEKSGEEHGPEGRPKSPDEEGPPQNNDNEPDRSELDDDEGSSEEMDPVDSPIDLKENIKLKFLVDMPEDFYEFWDFCKSLHPNNPSEALKDALGFTLVGPFDIVCDRHKGKNKNKRGKKPNFLRHWRYYYDPPEFLTVIKGDNSSQFHLGYYRDEPAEMPVFVAANSAKDSYLISPKGDNLFAAVKFYLDEKSKEVTGEKKTKLENVATKLTEWADKKNYSLDTRTKSMKDRDKKVVCKTFHGAGIVVKVDDNDVGYRPVPETPGDLKKIFKRIADSKTKEERNKQFDPLQELITLIQFANDECDYGEGLELGMDLFSFGDECFHRTILHLMPLAYQLLNRHEYATIIESHLKHRRKGADLSEID